MKPYKIKKGLISKKTNNKTTIFDAEKSHLITLNKTASYIFDLIKQGYTEKKIVAQINSAFKTQDENVEKDVKDIILELKKLGVIAI